MGTKQLRVGVLRRTKNIIAIFHLTCVITCGKKSFCLRAWNIIYTSAISPSPRLVTQNL